jgi:transcriptional regulator with XRE-family HTH domain
MTVGYEQTSRTVGAALKKLRETRGLSPVEAVRLFTEHGVHVTQSMLQNYELGHNSPTVSTFLQITHVYEVPPHVVLRNAANQVDALQRCPSCGNER